MIPVPSEAQMKLQEEEWNRVQEENALKKLLVQFRKDIKKAKIISTVKEVRFLVDGYYMMQNERIRVENQIRALEDTEEPHDILDYLLLPVKTFEYHIKTALDEFCDSLPIGRWLKNISGIGPVLAAGLIAHIDIKKALYTGNIWSYAGLTPTIKWEKGEKRPFNAKLRTLCYKIGESFIKQSHRENDIYGKLYQKRKVYEWRKNLNGEYAEEAKKNAEKFNYNKNTQTYKWVNGFFQKKENLDLDACVALCLDGKARSVVELKESAPKKKKPKTPQGVRMLCPNHIHSRCRRKIVKLFLSHLHDHWFRLEFGEEPPLPYAIALLEHGKMIPPPEWGES